MAATQMHDVQGNAILITLILQNFIRGLEDVRLFQLSKQFYTEHLKGLKGR